MKYSKVCYDVAFVPNEDDDLHCLQAAYMMIAKYFDPTFDISMREWSEITGFEEGKGTWENAGLLWFHAQGYEVKHFTLFDGGTFIKSPEEYLIRSSGKETGEWQIRHTNIPAEVLRVERLLATDIIEKKLPTMDHIRHYLDEGYLVRVLLNAAKLNGREGYLGHAVVVIGYSESYFILHDPGLPPYPSRKVEFDLFESAWANGHPEIKEMDIIRKP